MSLSNNGSSAIDKKLSSTGKTIRLNPDAAEFVPFALRSPSAAVGPSDASSSFGNFGTTIPGKTVVDRSESSVSNVSEDEVHRYWQHQLPDDITPDFNVTGDEDSQGINALPFSALSLADVNESSRFTDRFQKELSPHQTNGSSFSKKMGFPVSLYDENPLSSFQQQGPAKPWDIQGDQLLNGIREGPSYNGDHGHGYIDGMLDEQQMDGAEVNPLEFLASQFPGFAAESLADVYFANGGDLNLTIEMLTQLELQVDGGFNQNLNPKVLSAPNLSALDFPALSPADGQNGDDHQQRIDPYRPLEKEILLMFKSSSIAPSGGATDFASAVRKMAPQDSSIWKYNRDPNQDTTVGSSRSSHVLASSYNGGHGRMSYGDRLINRSSNRSAPVWLETGDAVGNVLEEFICSSSNFFVMRGEARDHARLRNAYFEQVYSLPF
ncbi:putative polyadenylate-binding protein-interacting protein/7, CUE [Helianthus debilis subsp. tardiflorus]